MHQVSRPTVRYLRAGGTRRSRLKGFPPGPKHKCLSNQCDLDFSGWPATDNGGLMHGMRPLRSSLPDGGDTNAGWHCRCLAVSRSRMADAEGPHRRDSAEREAQIWFTSQARRASASDGEVNQCVPKTAGGGNSPRRYSVPKPDREKPTHRARSADRDATPR